MDADMTFDEFNNTFETLSICDKNTKQREEPMEESSFKIELVKISDWQQENLKYASFLGTFDKWLIQTLMDPPVHQTFDEKLKYLCDNCPKQTSIPDVFQWLLKDKNNTNLVQWTAFNSEEWYEYQWMENALIHLQLLILSAPPLPMCTSFWRSTPQTIRYQENCKDVPNPIYCKNSFQNKNSAFCVVKRNSPSDTKPRFEIILEQGNHVLLLPNSEEAILPIGTLFKIKEIESIDSKLVYKVYQIEKGPISLLGCCKYSTLIELLKYFKIEIKEFADTSSLQNMLFEVLTSSYRKVFVTCDDLKNRSLLHSFFRMVLFFYPQQMIDEEEDKEIFYFEKIDQYVLRIFKRYIFTKWFAESKEMMDDQTSQKRKTTRFLNNNTDEDIFCNPKQPKQF